MGRVTNRVLAASLPLALACAGGPAVRIHDEPAAGASDRIVRVGEGVGIVTAETTEADLREVFGEDRVVDEIFYLAEGFCAPGTVVLPNTPDRLEIAWVDSLRTRPAIVRAREDGASWRTPRGVGIGTTLDELEAIAGGPVEFSGFGWDYGGGMAWSDGGEEPDAGLPRLGLRLAPVTDEGAREDPRYGEILGEGMVRSDHPIFDELTVRVAEMTMYWQEQYGEKDCEAIEG